MKVDTIEMLHTMHEIYTTLLKRYYAQALIRWCEHIDGSSVLQGTTGILSKKCLNQCQLYDVHAYAAAIK